MPIAPAVGYMSGARSTFAPPGTMGPAQTGRGTSSTRPAAMYPFIEMKAPRELKLDRVDDPSLCVDLTKAGKPCKGKKLPDSDYCFSHVRNHRDDEPTAD